MSFTVRAATPADAELIQAQRDAMFTDMGRGPEQIQAVSAAALAWYQRALRDGTYQGIFAVQKGEVVGGAGVIWQSLPPSPTVTTPTRAYLDNVYVHPEARGQKLARSLVEYLLQACLERGVYYVSLHASDAGRPTYAGLGFASTAEMNLKLEGQP